MPLRAREEVNKHHSLRTQPAVVPGDQGAASPPAAPGGYRGRSAGVLRRRPARPPPYLGVRPASPICPNRFLALCGDLPRGFGLFTAVFALSPATICLIRSPLNPMLSDTPHTLSLLFRSCSPLSIPQHVALGHENQHGSLTYSCLKFTYSHAGAEVTESR